MPTQSGQNAPSTFDLNGVGEGGDCLGMINEACLTDTIPGRAKDDAMTQCKRSFCHPLCTKMTWDCKASAKSDDKSFVKFTKYVENDSFRKALCAQIQAHACTDIMKCCQRDDPFVYNWVDGMTSAEDGIARLVPNPECAHDPNNKALSDILCNECQKQFKMVRFDASTLSSSFASLTIFSSTLLPRSSPHCLDVNVESIQTHGKRMRQHR